jgi:hypothetical protein
LTRDHLSAISGITLDGRLFMQVRPDSYEHKHAQDFQSPLSRTNHVLQTRVHHQSGQYERPGLLAK